MVQRKLHQFSNSMKALFLLLLFAKLVCSEEGLPMSVQRRLTGDIVYFGTTENDFESCRSPNTTYIVNERRCANVEEIMNGAVYIYNLYS